MAAPARCYVGGKLVGELATVTWTAGTASPAAGPRAAPLIALYLAFLALLPLHRLAWICGVPVTRTERQAFVLEDEVFPPLEAAQALVARAPLLSLHSTFGHGGHERWLSGREATARVRQLRSALGAGRVSERAARLASMERGSTAILTITYTVPRGVEVPIPVKVTATVHPRI